MHKMIASQDGRIAILTPDGRVFRAANGEQFVARDLALAEEVIAALAAPGC